MESYCGFDVRRLQYLVVYLEHVVPRLLQETGRLLLLHVGGYLLVEEVHHLEDVVRLPLQEVNVVGVLQRLVRDQLEEAVQRLERERLQTRVVHLHELRLLRREGNEFKLGQVLHVQEPAHAAQRVLALLKGLVQRARQEYVVEMLDERVHFVEWIKIQKFTICC